jgi:hypothetical protein
MWMVDPGLLCRKHLLGEHAEVHMFLGTLRKGKSVRGFLERKLLEPGSLFERHEALAKEMAARGYRHNSAMERGEVERALKTSGVTGTGPEVDKDSSLAELHRRCGECLLRQGSPQ